LHLLGCQERAVVVVQGAFHLFSEREEVLADLKKKERHHLLHEREVLTLLGFAIEQLYFLRLVLLSFEGERPCEMAGVLECLQNAVQWFHLPGQYLYFRSCYLPADLSSIEISNIFSAI
jgi:hypothetical protein